MIAAFAALIVGLGLGLVVVAYLNRAKERDDELVRLLELPYGEHDVPVEAVTESRAAVMERGVALAGQALERLNLVARVSSQLEQGRIPMRPGEFVLAALGLGVAGALVVLLLTGQVALALLGGLAGPAVAWALVNAKVARRRKAFEAQLPDALSLIASSLQAGHTALRAIQTMVEESQPPLSEEFDRVVTETRLGDPLVDALGRLAGRVGTADMAWVVQAIRIQQTVGGKLADLLFTLAEFMRAREEIRREVRVLTAEGRMSAWVLGALPVFVFLSVQVVSPGYMSPMMSGGGLIALAGAGLSVAAGVHAIMRMAKIEV
ncbi:MAG: type II secretion system F family protein [Acidimicrobiia bacterium]